MANHVYTNFEITFKSEEDCNDFAQLIKFDPTNEDITFGERIEICCNTMMTTLWPENEDTRTWWLDNVGAKWMYFDDVDQVDSTIYIQLTTAWDFPEGLFYKLTDFLRERYQDVTLQSTFEDEGYNFVGAAASNQEFRDIDYHHPDFEELDEYKDEDDCWTEEFYDEMMNIKEELLNNTLAFIQQIEIDNE